MVKGWDGERHQVLLEPKNVAKLVKVFTAIEADSDTMIELIGPYVMLLSHSEELGRAVFGIADAVIERLNDEVPPMHALTPYVIVQPVRTFSNEYGYRRHDVLAKTYVKRDVLVDCPVSAELGCQGCAGATQAALKTAGVPPVTHA